MTEITKEEYENAIKISKKLRDDLFNIYMKFSLLEKTDENLEKIKQETGLIKKEMSKYKGIILHYENINNIERGKENDKYKRK